MRIRKLIWILAGCCLLSGCRSGNANLNEKNVSDTEVTEESAESIEGEVEAKKNKNLQRAGKKPNRTFHRGFKRMSAKMFI